MHASPQPNEEKIIPQTNGVSELLAREAPEVLKKLPPEDQRKIVSVVREVATFQGPIPPPALIEGYEKVLPGTGQTIIDEFKAEGAHRRSIEKDLVKHSISVSRRAQIFAFSLGVLGLGGGIYLCSTGNNVGGLGMVGTSLLAIVGAFLKSLSSEKDAVKGDTTEKTPVSARTPSLPKAKNKKRR